MSKGPDDGRTFDIDVGSAAAASLQMAIFTKLTEFMGDYTDEILAQYILVLVAHGKHKAQAIKDLQAFLGDRSEDFVSWLWDYLCSNLQSQTSLSKVGSSVSSKPREKDIVKEVHETPSTHEDEKRKSKKDRVLRKKDLPDLNGHTTEDTVEHERDGAGERSNYGRHASRRIHMLHYGQNQEEKDSSDVEYHKRHSSPLRVKATRRLLQSAVRDAVGPAVVHIKSGVKRLRSVVSTEIESADTLEDPSKKQTCRDERVDDIRQVEVAATQASQVIDGDAKTDMIIEREHKGGSVWDRLGRTNDDRLHKFDNRKNYNVLTEIRSDKLTCSSGRSDSDRIKWRITGIQERMTAPIRKQKESENRQTTTIVSMNEGQYHMDLGPNSGVLARQEDSQNFGTEDQSNKDRDQSIIVKQKSAEDMDQHLAVTKANVPQSGSWSCHHENVLNICVNPNASQSLETPNQKGFYDRQIMNQEYSTLTSQGLHDEAVIQQDYPSDCHQNIMELKHKIEQVQSEMIKLRTNRTQAADKALKVQDASNKPTVFVTNIHFAASKDAIMAHFSQCGDIANVVMLMDGATGQPKGAAYIEFYMQSAADKALSLNNTSFYSRILKVVQKRDAVENTIAPSNAVVLQNPSRGRICRAVFSKFSRYGNPVNLQWRRETNIPTGTSQVNGKKQTITARSYTRSFSYVRNNLMVAGTIEGNTASSKLSTPVGQEKEHI